MSTKATGRIDLGDALLAMGKAYRADPSRLYAVKGSSNTSTTTWPIKKEAKHPLVQRTEVTFMSRILLVVLLVLAGCTTEGIQLVLRRVPDPGACPGAAIPFPMRFSIDADADEQVVAIAPDGRRYHVWWAPGFVAGDSNDPVVRDPSGTVVARDGEILNEPVLHGHAVCATGTSIYVLLV